MFLEMRKLKFEEIKSLVNVTQAGLITWASASQPGPPRTCHSAGRQTKSPGPGCRGPGGGGQPGLGLLEGAQSRLLRPHRILTEAPRLKDSWLLGHWGHYFLVGHREER